MKDELVGKLMKEFAALTAKTYSCFTDKRYKKVCHERET